MNVTFRDLTGKLATVPIGDVVYVKAAYAQSGRRARKLRVSVIGIRNGMSTIECRVKHDERLVKWHIQQVAKRHGIPLRLNLTRMP
jgi:uncharacterized membrane protein